jgi:uncharacterized protein YkwD
LAKIAARAARLLALLVSLTALTAIDAASAAILSRSAPPPAPPPAAPPAPVDPAVLRPALLARINQERAAARVRPLALDPALGRVAQARAEEIGRRGELPKEEESFLLIAQRERRLREGGYIPHGWTESLTASAGDVETVVRYWKSGDSFAAAMGPDYRDLGLGVATLRGVPLYVFLFAWPERDFFARQIAGLADLTAVRTAMLARVNAARRAAGVRPLATDPRLAAAAQAHAQDMLARAYYDHETPEGQTPRERVESTGYLAHKVGENIAEGQFSVEEVMSGWLGSSGHRRNLLDPEFRDLGVGLAVGRFEDRLRILWVQEFAVPGI